MADTRNKLGRVIAVLLVLGIVHCQESLQQQPQIVQPIVVEPVGVDPVVVEPVRVEPVRVQSVRVQPAQTVQPTISVQPVSAHAAEPANEAPATPEPAPEPSPEPSLTVEPVPAVEPSLAVESTAQAAAEPTPSTSYLKNPAAQQHATQSGQHVPEPSQPSAQAPSSAQQQRIDQMRRQYEQNQQQRLQAQQKQYRDPQYKQQVKISASQQQRRKQIQNTREQLAQLPDLTGSKSVLFEVDRQISEFILSPTTDHKIFLQFTVYALNDNSYTLVKDIEKTRPIRLYVYQNNNRIVAQSEFYFESVVVFDGRANSKYVVRFYNQGETKLLSMDYPIFVDQLHVATLYNKDKSLYHLQKLNFIGIRQDQVLERLRRNSLLDSINNETLKKFMKNYSVFQLVEMVLVLVVCAFQVNMVKKMFKNQSIV